MRTCKQCQLPMQEGYIVQVDNYGTPKIKKGTRKPDSLQAAVCPACGEISLYIEALPK